MGSIPSPTFSGVSKYANDLQQVLNRAVAIASLPLQQMQNQETTLTQQQSALTSLQSTFGSLQTAIQNLSSAAQGNVSATVSDPTSLQATALSSALPGTYSINITNLGSYTTTLSNSGLTTVTDPSSANISSSSSFTLTLNGTNHTITPSSNTLNGLATAINQAGLPVQATIVNVGSNSAPDYRLSVSSTNLAADTIQLNDGTRNLLGTLATGAAATYQVNGSLTNIQSNSRQITLAPGLTVNLLQQTSSPVTITVAQDKTSLSNSITAFANAYNSAVDALTAQHGQNAGPLSGSGTILSLGQLLRSITQYSGTGGAVNSIADMGLTLDKTGHLSFSVSAFTSQNLSAVQQFLGSATSGFLQTTTNAIKSAADVSSGLIQTSLTSIQNQITSQNAQIAAETNRITVMEQNLQKQLSAADSAIAVLQQQATFMAGLFATSYPGSGNVNIANSNNSSTGG